MEFRRRVFRFTVNLLWIERYSSTVPDIVFTFSSFQEVSEKCFKITFIISSLVLDAAFIGDAIAILYLSYALDQWFPTYKLRNCEIWAKIPRQNHFRIRTLIFSSMQSSSDSMHYHRCDIFRKKILWYPGWYKNIRYNICGIPCIRISCCVGVIAESQWRHAYCWPGRRDVVATLV
jgi:hypothetical protein